MMSFQLRFLKELKPSFLTEYGSLVSSVTPDRQFELLFSSNIILLDAVDLSEAEEYPVLELPESPI